MISLSEKYYLVVGDKFELFYRGVIKSFNPYMYYVKATCDKGYTYNRYYTYTPKEDEVGEYDLKIALYNEEGKVIEEKSTKLIVSKVLEVPRKVNILCFGDSLTVNGVWPNTGNTRYSELYPNKLSFIGKLKNGETGYEGYGGWQWKTFCEDNTRSQTSSVWIECEHNKTSADQHSVWECNEKKWILETICENKLKFKRYPGNNSVNPDITSPIRNVEKGVNKEEIVVKKFEYSDGNPFWNKEKNCIDFKYYTKINGYENIDYVFILLTWNGQYKPFNNYFSVHDEYSSIIIRQIHKDYPNAKIGLLGIQLPCPNGGITACYGANGYYHDWYGETITAFNYNEFLEEKCKLDEFKDYVTYFDTKAQFDSEYNYWTKNEPVNARNNEYTERLGVNGIHPSINGYNQIGDIFYRALVYMLNKNEKNN